MSGQNVEATFPVLVPIPAGRIGAAGLSGQTRDESIAAFLLGRTAVTNREYALFVAAGRAAAAPWAGNADFGRPAQPVVGVTWQEAMDYCAWLREQDAGIWRLPTEAEWEFAASGGLPGPATPWGDEIPAGEIPVGPLAGPWDAGRGTPNGYGLLDAGTIIHEWCLDWREAAPSSGNGERATRRRASRGGSWRHEIRWSSPGARSSLPPEYRYSDYGFRVLRELG